MQVIQYGTARVSKASNSVKGESKVGIAIGVLSLFATVYLLVCL